MRNFQVWKLSHFWQQTRWQLKHQVPQTLWCTKSSSYIYGVYKYYTSDVCNCLSNTCTNWYCPASRILHGTFWPFLSPRFTGRPVTITSHLVLRYFYGLNYKSILCCCCSTIIPLLCIYKLCIHRYIPQVIFYGWWVGGFGGVGVGVGLGTILQRLNYTIHSKQWTVETMLNMCRNNGMSE